MDYDTLQQTNQTLIKQLSELQAELYLYKQIHKQDGLANQLYLKTHLSGNRVWINQQTASIQQLQQLVQDDDVVSWISEKLGARYSDKW